MNDNIIVTVFDIDGNQLGKVSIAANCWASDIRTHVAWLLRIPIKQIDTFGIEPWEERT